MTSTIFGKNAYDDGIRDAIGTVIDDWGFRFPGIEDVEHVYFYAATIRHPGPGQTLLRAGLPSRPRLRKTRHRCRAIHPARLTGVLGGADGMISPL